MSFQVMPNASPNVIGTQYRPMLGVPTDKSRDTFPTDGWRHV